ncbi:hypothetical protein ALC53_14272 [Atta colombica]|uniref:Torsin-1A-interacting protein 1 n=2 Tax=Atta colombica TaxID=520822 RepID=A0A195AT17_9HYME|nr:hypothetical protein ALC53_14272 [Atta colombica]
MTSIPSIPKSRKSIHSPPMTSTSSKPKSRSSLKLKVERNISRQQNISKSFETEELFKDQSYETTQVTESSSEEDEKTSLCRSQNRSRTISPERNVRSQKIKQEDERDTTKNKQNISSLCFIFILIVLGIIVFELLLNNNKRESTINNPLLLTKSVQNLKASFSNQELDIWNDILSAINEVISRTPKLPSVILLFAKETTTMNCLATKLADMSSDILNADNYLIFNPKDFGNDAGDIITTLNEHSLEKKKVVIIHDILNINAEAIKALHNLCDRTNPLVAEAIYILTMQTNSSLSQQKKLNFVENQIYNRLSKSIDQDILSALITRITDGIIISVQPEPQLRYC